MVFANLTAHYFTKVYMQLHTLKGYIQHIYLAEHDAGIMLLDGCSRADVETVTRFITCQLKRPLSDLKLILVTHMHPDHAGGAHKLREISGAQIAAHPNAPTWYRGVMGRTAHAIDVLLTWYVAGRLGRPKKHIWYPPILKPDISLNDGQPVPEFDGWKVHYTPGHTDHDLSVEHVPSGLLYVADLMVRVKGALRPPYPLCHPNQYRQSLQRVQSMDVKTLCFAHLPPRPHDESDFDAVLHLAPVLPSNHWHAGKNRVLGFFGMQKTQF